MKNPFEVVDALMAAHATNDRINRYLIENVPDEAWNMKGPGGKGRTVAAIFAHMHNVRLMWLKSAGGALPEKLDVDNVTKKGAVAALDASNEALRDVLSNALRGDGRIKGFKPDVCSFIAYLFAHDAHHRGQISMLTRQLGHPLSQSAMYGLWEWGTR